MKYFLLFASNDAARQKDFATWAADNADSIQDVSSQNLTTASHSMAFHCKLLC